MASEFLDLDDDSATAALGQRLAAQLRPGDFVLLEGDLGAGKTTLARALVRALMNDPALEVPSPSFALVQPYSRAGRQVLHADFYRLSGRDEAEDLGVFDDADAIVIVEWPERAAGAYPPGAITVRLSIPKGGKGRRAEIVR